MDEPVHFRFRLTPDRLIIGVLIVECLLWLSQRFQWPMWHKGYAVLSAVAVVGATMLLMLLGLIVPLLLRWRFQFGIRSLLVLTVAVAIACSWLSWEVKNAREQREAAITIRTLGGFVGYNWQYKANGSLVQNARPPAEWLRRLLEVDLSSSVVFVSVPNGHVTDAGLSHLASLTELRWLNLPSPEITDTGLTQLAGLTQLQVLYLDNTRITDAGLANLAGLAHLQVLSLDNTQITDSGLAHLTRLRQLHDLRLHNTQITDAGLAYLARLSQLQKLWLIRTQVSEEGVIKLQQALPTCIIFD